MKGIAEGSLVSLLSGQERMVEELNNAFFKSPIYLYSLNEQGITVGTAILDYVGYGQTLKVTLDDSSVLIVGEDQEFIMRDGSVKAAKFLEADDVLLPLYREISDKSFQLVGYELYHDPIRGRRHFTHRLVGKWKYPGHYPKNGYVVHHKDYRKLNNDPSNLVLMDKGDHVKLHQDFLRHLLENPEFKAFMREVSRRNMIDRWQEPGWAEKVLQARIDAGQIELARELMSKNWEDPEFRARKSVEMKKNWEDTEWRERASECMRQVSLASWSDPEYKEMMKKINSDSSKKRWEDKEYKEKMREVSRVGMKANWEKEGFGELVAESRRKRWEDPEFRAYMTDQQSQAGKKAWTDPESSEKLRASRKARADAMHQANIDRGITFDTINDAIYYSECNSLCKLGKYFEVSHTVITRILKRSGIENPSQYVRTYENHRIEAIEPTGFANLYSLNITFSCKGVFLNGTEHNYQ